MHPEARALVRRWIRAAADRARVAVEDAPARFPDFHAPGSVHTPLAILQHMTGIARMVDARLRGNEPAGRPAPGAGGWEEEREALADGLTRIDALLEAGEPDPAADLPRLAQAPLSDLVHHAGQLALLRRLAGAPPRPIRYLHEARPPVDRVETARAYVDASNRHDLDSIAALLAPDARYESSAVGEHRGRSAILAMMTTFFDAMPDAGWEIGEPRADGEGGVAFPFVLTGTGADGAIRSEGSEHLRIGVRGEIRAVSVARGGPGGSAAAPPRVS